MMRVACFTLAPASSLKCTVTRLSFAVASPAAPSLAPVTSVFSLYENCISDPSATFTVIVFAAAFYLFREAFKRRSGGIGFR